MIFWFNQIRLNLLYHCYLKPNPASQFYLGTGIGPGICIESSSHWSSGGSFYSLSPVADVGYEYRTNSGNTRFISAQISPPWALLDAEYLWRPVVLVNYGFGF